MQDNDWKEIRNLFVHQASQWKRVKYVNVKQDDTWKIGYIGYDPTDIVLDAGQALVDDTDAGSQRGQDMHLGKLINPNPDHLREHGEVHVQGG